LLLLSVIAKTNLKPLSFNSKRAGQAKEKSMQVFSLLCGGVHGFAKHIKALVFKVEFRNHNFIFVLSPVFFFFDVYARVCTCVCNRISCLALYYDEDRNSIQTSQCFDIIIKRNIFYGTSWTKIL